MMGVVALLSYCVYAEVPEASVAPDVVNGNFKEPLSFDFFALPADQRAAYLVDLARQFEAAGAYSARYRVANVMVAPLLQRNGDPTPGYYYTGTHPLSVDVTDGTVANCP